MRTDYREMELTSDSHFYNIPVNTSHSSVHIPTNVFDLKREVVEDILKTEPLDDMFRKNYESDPALSWQYFGSVTGMLRQYPAMQWRTLENEQKERIADLYDCRVRSWFIEASTCSKDMVILMDVSGSMTGMGKTIGKARLIETESRNQKSFRLKKSNFILFCIIEKLYTFTIFQYCFTSYFDYILLDNYRARCFNETTML